MNTNVLTWPVGLTKRREVIVLADRTGVTPREAAAAWMEFLEWVSDQQTAGVLKGVRLETIDRLTGLSGFAACLADDLWLSERSDGVHVRQWDEVWSPEVVAKKGEAEMRKARRRAPSGQVSVKSADKCPDNPPHTPPVCSGFDFSFGGNASIQEAWKDFHSHREQKDKKGWTQSAQLRNAKKVADIAKRRGQQAAIVAIGRSIESGWTGIFEPPQTTEHDLAQQQHVDGAAEAMAWYKGLSAAEQSALLVEFRATPRKEQDKPGAWKRWLTTRKDTP